MPRGRLETAIAEEPVHARVVVMAIPPRASAFLKPGRIINCAPGVVILPCAEVARQVARTIDVKADPRGGRQTACGRRSHGHNDQRATAARGDLDGRTHHSFPSIERAPPSSAEKNRRKIRLLSMCRFPLDGRRRSDRTLGRCALG